MFVLGNHGGGVSTHGLAYSPSGRLLVSGGQGVRVWDLGLRCQVREIALLGGVNALAFSPDGQLAVASGGGTTTRLGLFDLESAGQMRPFPALCQILSVAVSANGKVLAAAGHDHRGGPLSRRTYDVRRWDPASGRKGWPLVGHSQEVTFLAISPNSQWLLSGSKDRTARLWCLAPRAQVATFRHRVILRAGAFSPDGRSVATAAGESVGLWDTYTFKLRKWLLGHRTTVYGLAVAPDGQLFTGSGDGTVRVWDAGGKERACFDWSVGPLHSVAVAPDGLTAAAAGASGDIVVWDLGP